MNLKKVIENNLHDNMFPTLVSYPPDFMLKAGQEPKTNLYKT